MDHTPQPSKRRPVLERRRTVTDVNNMIGAFVRTLRYVEVCCPVLKKISKEALVSICRESDGVIPQSTPICSKDMQFESDRLCIACTLRQLSDLCINMYFVKDLPATPFVAVYFANRTYLVVWTEMSMKESPIIATFPVGEQIQAECLYRQTNQQDEMIIVVNIVSSLLHDALKADAFECLWTPHKSKVEASIQIRRAREMAMVACDADISNLEDQYEHGRQSMLDEIERRNLGSDEARQHMERLWEEMKTKRDEIRRHRQKARQECDAEMSPVSYLYTSNNCWAFRLFDPQNTQRLPRSELCLAAWGSDPEMTQEMLGYVAQSGPGADWVLYNVEIKCEPD